MLRASLFGQTPLRSRVADVVAPGATGPDRVKALRTADTVIAMVRSAYATVPDPAPARRPRQRRRTRPTG